MPEDLHRRIVYCILGPRRAPPGTDLLSLQRKRFREVYGSKMGDALSAASCVMSMLRTIEVDVPVAQLSEFLHEKVGPSGVPGEAVTIHTDEAEIIWNNDAEVTTVGTIDE